MFHCGKQRRDTFVTTIRVDGNDLATLITYKNMKTKKPD